MHRPSTKNAYWPHVLNINIDGDDLVATMPSQSIQISETEMYNLYFMHYDTSLQDVVIEGNTIWKNPTGYRPGRMSPLMKIYGLMPFAFVILGIFWFSHYAMHWREVVQLQNCITVVITLGMLEMAFWYFEYAEFNETGVRPTGITVWDVTFSTVKHMVARLIILMVSMGYSVVRPTLGGLTSKVVVLGGTFLFASEVIELVEMLVQLVFFLVQHGFSWFFWWQSWMHSSFFGYLLLSPPHSVSFRYAYSDEAGEEFDEEENLALIKPSQVARDVPISQESRHIHIKNGSVDEDLEEDKIE